MLLKNKKNKKFVKSKNGSVKNLKKQKIFSLCRPFGIYKINYIDDSEHFRRF